MRIRIIRNTRINTRASVLQYAHGGLKYGRRAQLARRRTNVASTQYFFVNFIGNCLFRLYMTRRRTTWTRRCAISASHRPKLFRTLAGFHGGGNANPANPRMTVRAATLGIDENLIEEKTVLDSGAHRCRPGDRLRRTGDLKCRCRSFDFSPVSYTHLTLPTILLV